MARQGVWPVRGSMRLSCPRPIEAITSQYALRSKHNNAAVHQKETELDKKSVANYGFFVELIRNCYLGLLDVVIWAPRWEVWGSRFGLIRRVIGHFFCAITTDLVSLLP